MELMEKAMSEPKKIPRKPSVPATPPPPGVLVEDTSVVGGRDKATGADVIRPKTSEGKADKMTEATDRRENE